MRSSWSSSSSPSAALSPSMKYHVFLSFRGVDTRKTFVDHLYSALAQQGIYSYKDDETLYEGELIGPSLMEAIEGSQIAIIVFSKNYADSSWCLDELAYIMKCKDTRGQIVMPIFYDIDPSDVRKQKRKYGEAFDKHALENNIKIKSWRKALVDASNISGWEIMHIANGHESKCIKEIVDTISHKLHFDTSSENENLVGIEARVQDLKSKLQIGCGGVSMIGIWGVGGGGKTTLASSIYDEMHMNFDGCCFVENIREESSKNGLKKLQEQIISSVLKQKQVQVSRVEEGRRIIKGRLCHRKVLVVLDDVDHLDQLKALAGSHDWFGEGSRIIVTTRDEHVLTAHKVNVIHRINLLNNDEAMKLFRKHAHGDYIPMEDYELISKDVVSYAGGLPLALTILGSFLCDKDINEWISALARLKEIPDNGILEKIKISFDGLNPVEKELFLDIACFFRRVDKHDAMETLDACGFHPVIGVKVLIQKALISISDGKFDMHDLVQEMGHYIVRGEHPRNPEKHSRVWKKEDVLKLCALDATTELDMIEAISSEYNKCDPLQRVPPIVANMKNLRWIDWKGDYASPLPTNFPPSKLCCLRLYRISQKQLWEGYKYLPNLRILKLWGLYNLTMTPDFHGLPNLERFILYGSPYLEVIHPSIGILERLICLHIEECIRLTMFPRITRLKKLETLTFSWCTELCKLSEIQEHMNNFPPLQFDINSRKEVASYEKSCTNDHATCLTCGSSNVHGYECFLGKHDLHHNHIGLQFFHQGLRKLDLTCCNLGDKDTGSNVWELPNLQELNLTANNFSQLNFSLMRLPRLKWLNISNCKGLVELSELPSSIAILIADFCTSLESFGDISNCKWLWKVSIRGENKLGPFGGDILLDSLLQGNAIEDHFINVTPLLGIPKVFVAKLSKSETFTLHLPHDWHNEYCGFLICLVTRMKTPNISIIIKHELNKDSQLDDKSNKAIEPKYDGNHGTTMSIGYVSLKHTALLNASYNMISFVSYGGESYVAAQLVTRKGKGDQMQTTKVASDSESSEFWKECEDERTFTLIQPDLKSSIKILWQPYKYWY